MATSRGPPELRRRTRSTVYGMHYVPGLAYRTSNAADRLRSGDLMRVGTGRRRATRHTWPVLGEPRAPRLVLGKAINHQEYDRSRATTTHREKHSSAWP